EPLGHRRHGRGAGRTPPSGRTGVPGAGEHRGDGRAAEDGGPFQGAALGDSSEHEGDGHGAEGAGRPRGVAVAGPEQDGGGGRGAYGGGAPGAISPSCGAGRTRLPPRLRRCWERQSVSEELQGAWVVVGGKREGPPDGPLGDVAFRGARLVFAGDRVTLHA